MRRVDGKRCKSHRHPNYQKHRKRNDTDLRRRRKERKYENGWWLMAPTTPQTRRTAM